MFLLRQINLVGQIISWRFLFFDHSNPFRPDVKGKPFLKAARIWACSVWLAGPLFHYLSPTKPVGSAKTFM